MLDALFDKLVTLRRPKAGSLSASNAVEYEELVDEGGDPLRLKCRLEGRRRRVLTTAEEEVETDATMIFRQGKPVEVLLEDVVVVDGATAYRVAALEDQIQMGLALKYARASLVRTRLPVPEDSDAG